MSLQPAQPTMPRWPCWLCNRHLRPARPPARLHGDRWRHRRACGSRPSACPKRAAHPANGHRGGCPPI